MRFRNNSQIAEVCEACPSRTEGYFCSLPESALSRFHSLKITHLHPKGTTLFMEGQPANGVYVLCSGRVKLSTNSEDGRSIIVRVAEAGEVLGLAACVAGSEYEATAQVIDQCRANFFKGVEFLDFLGTHNAAAINAIRELSQNYHKAHVQICSLGLSASAGDKLAKLFLEWCEMHANGDSAIRMPMTYTHEEIAEMIGTSRETVTRLLTEFKKRKLIVMGRTDLFIPDKKKLEAVVGTRHPHSL